MCKLLGIEKTRTTAYHPQGNGQVENWNKSMKKMLMTLVDDNCRDWDEKLPSALMAYRSSVQESTRETPFAMMFGAEMQIPFPGRKSYQEPDQNPI
jgi:transposase InsO family protein